MGNLNINFGSGKGTIYSNQNSENSLYSLLKGNQENSNSGGVRVSGTSGNALVSETNSKGIGNVFGSTNTLGSTNALTRKNSLFNGSAGNTFSNGLFSGAKNSSIVNSINLRTSSMNSISTLKEQNPTLWAFLHPAEAKAEGMDKSDEIKMLEESLKDNGLDYDYKKVSKAIKDSKDSGSAEKAVSTARKSLSDLKKKVQEQSQSDESSVDPYEVQAALVHAEKMLHIAEKHLKNVKEEEIAERNQKGGEFIDLGIKDNLSVSENSASSREDAQKAEAAEDESIRNDVKAFMSSVGYSFDMDGNIVSFKGQSITGISPQQYERAYLKGISSNVDAISLNEIASNVTGVSDAAALSRNAFNEMALTPNAGASSALTSGAAGSSDDISSLMNDLGISDEALPDFLDDMTTPNLYGMEPTEVKMLKLKHRLKENIAIAKADAEYLKVVFERMNASGSGAASGSSTAAAGGNVAGSAASSFPGGSGFEAVSLPTGEVVSSGGSVTPLGGSAGSDGIDISV